MAPEIPKASKNLCGQETVHKRAQKSYSVLPTNSYLTIENSQGRQACKVRRLLCMFPETAVSGRGLFSREGSCQACAALGAPAQSWFLYFSGWAQKAMGPPSSPRHIQRRKMSYPLKVTALRFKHTYIQKGRKNSPAPFSGAMWALF